MKLRCVAVDDEPLALRLTSSFIEQTPFLELVAAYPGAVQALAAIERERIQLLFLDIQMPDLNGMELARVLASLNQPPRIVFTTAFNHFAIEGYKVDALDYLLKPFGYEEFLRSASKAKQYFEAVSTPVAPADEGFLFVKSGYKMVRVDFGHILFIESVKDYLKIYLSGTKQPLMTLSSLRSIEEKLPASRFLRVHRSFIVAVDKIDAITRNNVHVGDAVITVGEQYKEAFRQLLDRWM